MSSQQPLFRNTNSEADSAAETAAYEPAPVWLQRMSLVVLVLFCFLLGVLVAILPWSPAYWDHNTWLLEHREVNELLHLGWMRGLVSGIGLLDIWIGVSEAMHYRDRRATHS